jgi:hypothetical protein
MMLNRRQRRTQASAERHRARRATVSKAMAQLVANELAAASGLQARSILIRQSTRHYEKQKTPQSGCSGR